VHSLMSFARTDWMPSHATLALLLAIIEQLSTSPFLRELFQEDPGWLRLQGLAWGTIEGFTKDQQAMAQQALSLYPPPKPAEPEPVPQPEVDPAAAQVAAAQQRMDALLAQQAAAAAAPQQAATSHQHSGGADPEAAHDAQEHKES